MFRLLTRLPNKREGMRTGTRIPRASQERGRSAKHTGDARRGSCRVAGAINQEFLRCRNSVKELVVDIQEKAKLRVVEHIQLAHRCGFRKRPAKDANGQVAQILEDRAVCPYSARLELDTSFVNLDRQCVVSSEGCAQRGRQRGGCRGASAPKQRSRNDRTDNARQVTFHGTSHQHGQSLATAIETASHSPVRLTNSRPTHISRPTLRGSQHNAKPAPSKNVCSFIWSQALEEAGSGET